MFEKCNVGGGEIGGGVFGSCEYRYRRVDFLVFGPRDRHGFWANNNAWCKSQQ